MTEQGAFEDVRRTLAESTESDLTALYRHFDAQGALLYVGVSKCAVTRTAAHFIASHWFGRIARIDIEWLPSRQAALEAEMAAIRTESPLFNVAKRTVTSRVAATNAGTSLRTASRDDATRRTVRFNPLYTPNEIAEMMGVRPSDVERLLDAGEMGGVRIAAKTKKGFVRRVTGWQFIEYLEHLESAA